MTDSINKFKPPANCLDEKKVLITGATGGLGSALAKRAAQLRATVILAGRNLPVLEALYDEIELIHGIQPALFPVSQETATQQDYAELATTLKNEFGELHALVHCAAQLGMPTPIEHYPEKMWNDVMQVNVNSAFLVTRALLPLMQSTGNASIVLTTDHRQTAFWGAYGASKAALDAFTLILADEISGKVGPSGHPSVSVNAVNPGAMRTRLRAKSFAGELPKESPLPETKVDALIHLISRQDPSLHGEILSL